jgi:putative ABC transport system substrate-binding protein
MKRVLLILAICLALGLVFGSGASAQKMIRIGEHQIVSHPALDDDGKGFAAALAEEGFVEGKNLTINRQNAQGDQANCAIIARKFEDDKVDLIHAIQHTNAQAMAKITKTIPVVFLQ